MSSKVLFLLLSFLALASGKTASRTAVRQGAASNVPSRYMLWQTPAEDKSKPRAAKKEAERPPSIWKKLQNVLIVDVNLLPDRWMSLA